jgi:hypothetical protein
VTLLNLGLELYKGAKGGNRWKSNPTYNRILKDELKAIMTIITKHFGPDGTIAYEPPEKVKIEEIVLPEEVIAMEPVIVYESRVEITPKHDDVISRIKRDMGPKFNHDIKWTGNKSEYMYMDSNWKDNNAVHLDIIDEELKQTIIYHHYHTKRIEEDLWTLRQLYELGQDYIDDFTACDYSVFIKPSQKGYKKESAVMLTPIKAKKSKCRVVPNYITKRAALTEVDPIMFRPELQIEIEDSALVTRVKRHKIYRSKFGPDDSYDVMLSLKKGFRFTENKPKNSISLHITEEFFSIPFEACGQTITVHNFLSLSYDDEIKDAVSSTGRTHILRPLRRNVYFQTLIVERMFDAYDR